MSKYSVILDLTSMKSVMLQLESLKEDQWIDDNLWLMDFTPKNLRF